MGLFTKNEEAKARRTQERQEQQKKEKAVPPPYVHTPTHALKDSLLSVPNAYKGTDRQRLKKAHQQRLENEASALAAGSDTNVTNIPAKYWQGQPLPAQFKAPTPANFHELVLSKPSLRGKKIKLPVAATAQKQPQPPVDEGYASGPDRNRKGKPSREPAKGPSREPRTEQSQKDDAAEEGREAELRRLRRRIRELEGNQRAQNDHSSKTTISTVPASVPRRNAGTTPGFKSRNSSSDTVKGRSSGWSNRAESPTPPSSTSAVRRFSGADGVNRYDWAIHWAHVNAKTEEERAKLPSPIDPQQRTVPMVKDLSCYASLDESSRHFHDASTGEPSSDSSVRPSTKAPGRLGSVSSEPSATVVRPKATDDGGNLIEMSSNSSLADFDFGFAPANTPSTTVVESRPRSERKNRTEKPSHSFMADSEFGLAATTTPNALKLDDYSYRHRSQANKAEPRRKRS